MKAFAYSFGEYGGKKWRPGELFDIDRRDKKQVAKWAFVARDARAKSSKARSDEPNLIDKLISEMPSMSPEDAILAERAVNAIMRGLLRKDGWREPDEIDTPKALADYISITLRLYRLMEELRTATHVGEHREISPDMRPDGDMAQQCHLLEDLADRVGIDPIPVPAAPVGWDRFLIYATRVEERARTSSGHEGASPDSEKPAAKGTQAHRHAPRRPLADGKVNCLLALLQLKAVSRDQRASSSTVAVKATGAGSNTNTKKVLRHLVVERLADSLVGTKGGYWLTKRGIETAKSHMPK